MKKAVALLLALVMVFALCGCGAENASTDAPEPEVSEAENAETTEIEDEIEPVKPEAPDTAIVFTNDGDVEETNCQEITQLFEDNPMKFNNKYVGARVLVTGTVKSVELDKTVFIEGNKNYSLEAVINLDGGWSLSASKNDTRLADLSIGDKIRFIGAITNKISYKAELAVINTLGYAIMYELYDIDNDCQGMFDLIERMLYNSHRIDCADFVPYFESVYPNETEKITELKTLAEKLENSCYEGTSVQTYDNYFGVQSAELSVSVPSYVEDSVEDTPYSAHVYFDSNVLKHVASYVNYLEALGYTQNDGYVKIKVDDKVLEYPYYSKSGTDILFAFSEGSTNGNSYDYVIIIAYPLVASFFNY